MSLDLTTMDTSERTFVITDHARARMEEMGLTEDDVRTTVQFPQTVTPNADIQSFAYRRRRIVVHTIEYPDRQFVVTVVWSDLELAKLLDRHHTAARGNEWVDRRRRNKHRTDVGAKTIDRLKGAGRRSRDRKAERGW